MLYEVKANKLTHTQILRMIKLMKYILIVMVVLNATFSVCYMEQIIKMYFNNVNKENIYVWHSNS